MRARSAADFGVKGTQPPFKLHGSTDVVVGAFAGEGELKGFRWPALVDGGGVEGGVKGGMGAVVEDAIAAMSVSEMKRRSRFDLSTPLENEDSRNTRSHPEVTL